MKSGPKRVVLVYPDDKPEKIEAYSTYKVACKAMGISYDSFNRWKRDWDEDNIHVKGFVVMKKRVIRDDEGFAVITAL